MERRLNLMEITDVLELSVDHFTCVLLTVSPVHSLSRTVRFAAIGVNMLNSDGVIQAVEVDKESGKDLRLDSEIDKKMKDYSDFVLHSLECLSTRVSQLESRAFQLENAIDDLKEAIEMYSMKRDRKQKELEDMLIQGVVKDLKEEPELARPQLSKNDPQLEKQDRTGKPGQTLPVPVTLPQAHSPSSSAPNLPHQTPTMAAPETVPPPHIIPEGMLHSFSAAGPVLLNVTPQIVTPKQEFYFRGPWSDTVARGHRREVDDVIGKFVTMGFHRELVRTTVKKLKTEWRVLGTEGGTR
ncbi:hypothetical protein K2173_022800 [Erythroxylum novogranatense]|uniref:FRIGIDA-like protein n=1 Tax=Erythroxylum novogranatense TaxID=1862640 RepID=A0AAV8SNJ6_9ROSI|nr:hypothetical protein K2173_022800 [Erythroxylum novogranatense]